MSNSSIPTITADDEAIVIAKYIAAWMKRFPDAAQAGDKVEVEKVRGYRIRVSAPGMKDNVSGLMTLEQLAAKAADFNKARG